MNEERLKILRMLENKKITAAEAAKLLETLENSETNDETFSGKGAKNLKIKVYEGDLTQPKVNVKVPLLLVKFIGKVVPEKAEVKLNKHNISMEKIMEMVEKDQSGKILEVEEENEKVEIYIE